MQSSDGSDGTQFDADACDSRPSDAGLSDCSPAGDDDAGRYVRTLHDAYPLPVDQEVDPEVRTRILRTISRVKLTDEEVAELDARMRGTPLVLRMFRRVLGTEIARLVSARKARPARGHSP